MKGLKTDFSGITNFSRI